MAVRIAVDLNVRVRGNQTYAGFEDTDGGREVGDVVEVYEAESGICGVGTVVEIDVERELIYLAVDWASLHDPDLKRVHLVPVDESEDVW